MRVIDYLDSAGMGYAARVGREQSGGVGTTLGIVALRVAPGRPVVGLAVDRMPTRLQHAGHPSGWRGERLAGRRSNKNGYENPMCCRG